MLQLMFACGAIGFVFSGADGANAIAGAIMGTIVGVILEFIRRVIVGEGE